MSIECSKHDYVPILNKDAVILLLQLLLHPNFYLVLQMLLQLQVRRRTI